MHIFQIFYEQSVSSTEDASVRQHSLEKEAPMQAGAQQETGQLVSCKRPGAP